MKTEPKPCGICRHWDIKQVSEKDDTPYGSSVIHHVKINCLCGVLTSWSDGHPLNRMDMDWLREVTFLQWNSYVACGFPKPGIYRYSGRVYQYKQF